MSDCIFCRIAQHSIPASIVYEDEHIIAFKDLYPKAPVHLLVIPKQHLDSLAHVNEKHAALMGHLFTQIPLIAEQQGLVRGFRTILNTGAEGGQEVYHLHAHILGGGKLPPML